MNLLHSTELLTLAHEPAMSGLQAPPQMGTREVAAAVSVRPEFLNANESTIRRLKRVIHEFELKYKFEHANERRYALAHVPGS